MITHIIDVHKDDVPYEIKFLYSVKNPAQDPEKNPQNMDGLDKILFLPRLKGLFKTLGERGDLSVFLTSGLTRRKGIEVGCGDDDGGERIVKYRKGRITEQNVLEALGPVDGRKGTLCYICGVPTMTDSFVSLVKGADGMSARNVFSERWW